MSGEGRGEGWRVEETGFKFSEMSFSPIHLYLDWVRVWFLFQIKKEKKKKKSKLEIRI